MHLLVCCIYTPIQCFTASYALSTADSAFVLPIKAALTEAQWRERLGIPKNASRVLILSQSSHMDWDWTKTFLGYYKSKVDDILTSATTVLSKYSGEKQPYYYSVAETGFLQHFWQQHPDSLVKLRQSGHTLHLVGGGITSPDSLLNHGEAFIRNFLVGQAALRNVSLPTMTNIWIPDDLYDILNIPHALLVTVVKA